MTCAMRESVDRHFAGAIRREAEHALREHLTGCDECKQYYQRHLLLAKLDPRALDAKTRLAVGLGLRARHARPMGLAVLGFAVAAAAALVMTAPRQADPGFTARGMAVDAPAVHLSVFRVVNGTALPVSDRIDAADALAFSYENRAGKSRLMVFGVDEHQHVYWFFPAWQDPASDPQALSIAATEHPVELREAVVHALDGQSLEVRAIFTDEVLTVREAERRIRGRGAPLSSGALEQTIALKVSRGDR
jgi:hypothetical protein